MNLLDEVTVIDLTARLPGPYAGYLLSQMGARVIKVENMRHLDAFSDERLHELDPIFKVWYQNLNIDKEKCILDFSDNKDLEQLKAKLTLADIVIVPNKEKLIEMISLYEIAQDTNMAIIKVGGHHEKNHSMHDLNALSELGAFKMHTKFNDAPPFLPFAGISYGQMIATQAIALYLKCLRQKKSIIFDSYLDLSVKLQYAPFWDEGLTSCEMHLHNGLFPCYNLYKTKDGGSIAVCAVEDKFWNIFTKSLELPLTLDDRYDTSQRVFKIIADKITSLTTQEVKTKLKEHDCCVTIVTP